MLIKFECPNGHKIKASSEFSGKKANCPKCRAAFVVPSPKPLLPAPRPMTESGVMRVLGDATLPPPAPEWVAKEIRKCPRCSKTISESVTLCNHCHLYLGAEAGKPKLSRPVDTGI